MYFDFTICNYSGAIENNKIIKSTLARVLFLFSERGTITTAQKPVNPAKNAIQREKSRDNAM
jgi:hypothetical protein